MKQTNYVKKGVWLALTLIILNKIFCAMIPFYGGGPSDWQIYTIAITFGIVNLLLTNTRKQGTIYSQFVNFARAQLYEEHELTDFYIVLSNTKGE